MHTKEELTKKKAKSSEQLDLVKTISSADKVKHQRRWLYLALFITTGISIFFWIYHTFKTTKISLSLPKISFNINQTTPNHSLSPQLSSLLSQHQEIIGFYLSHHHPPGYFGYGSLSDLNFDTLKTTLASQSPILKSTNASLLPEGVDYREQTVNSADQTTIFSLITNPLDQILIVIRYRGSSDSLKTLIPTLISTAYWAVSSN